MEERKSLHNLATHSSMNGPKVEVREVRERGLINFPFENPAVPQSEGDEQ